MRELLPMVISVILFIVTIIIIATLRKADQKNRKIEHIKKYVNHFSEKMKQSGDEIQTKVVEVESKLHEVQQDTAVAVTKIHREKEELFLICKTCKNCNRQSFNIIMFSHPSRR